MKISFQEVLTGKEWIHTELMTSLTDDIISQASKDLFYDVKLVVNGIEVEPQMFNKLVNNITKYIDNQAKSIVKEKLEEAENKTHRLNRIIDEVSDKIINEYDLDETEF